MTWKRVEFYSHTDMMSYPTARGVAYIDTWKITSAQTYPNAPEFWLVSTYSAPYLVTEETMRDLLMEVCPGIVQ